MMDVDEIVEDNSTMQIDEIGDTTVRFNPVLGVFW